MYVLISGRLAITGRDAVGQALPVAAFAQMMGATLEDLAEVVPGEVLAEIGALSGQPSVSVMDAKAIGEVEAILVPPEGLRALLIAEAELGERILRALILRRVALIDLGFGGPVLIGSVNSPEVTRLSGLLGRTGIPFRVIDPDRDADASALLARFAPSPGELPIVVIPDGTVLKNPTKQELARALGLVATTLRSDPYDVAIVGAGPAGLATAVYGASEGLSILVLEALTYGGQAGASARIENYLGFPTGVSGQALMSLAFTQAQKFGAEFSLSTEVKRLDCTSEMSGPDPVHVLHLADGRQVRARAVVVATGARYRRPEIPNLSQFEGRGVSYWASPVEARLCREQDVVLLGGGNSAGQAAVFLASHARHVRMLVRGPSLASTMSHYLVERIAACPNVGVIFETEIVELLGPPDPGLRGVRWRNRRTGKEEEHAIFHVFLFTGADPAASWLAGCGIPLDEKGFVRTGADVRSTGREPLPLETGVEGIFAVGDVRCGSVKRVGAAIGEGAAVVAETAHFPRPASFGDCRREARRSRPARRPHRVASARNFLLGAKMSAFGQSMSVFSTNQLCSCSSGEPRSEPLFKQLSKGAHLFIPVDAPGALFSAGDAHYAQGDCETCGTAIEMNATLHVRFGLRKGEAAQKGIRYPRFARQDYYLPPEFAALRRFYATTGISVTREGVDQSEDVSLAARNALLNMIDHLTERGWTRQQAYALCSLAVDLKISQLVDVPNMLVSAFLPEDIFTR